MFVLSTDRLVFEFSQVKGPPVLRGYPASVFPLHAMGHDVPPLIWRAGPLAGAAVSHLSLIQLLRHVSIPEPPLPPPLVGRLVWRAL